uniref:Immunoglobulin V-set domain-containing protein n=1 Tax=Catagonus wagneri TaxID=51154 RepID=A0A8C3YHJ8_9CETA
PPPRVRSWTRLCLPGCLSVSGPLAVTGTEGGSLSVRCRYEEKFINNNKYWVKTPCFLSGKIVETAESEGEVRDGRVSIRDHPANLTFTVTLERLTEDDLNDADTYWCGIEKPGVDLGSQIKVTVVPGKSVLVCTASLPARHIPEVSLGHLLGRPCPEPVISQRGTGRGDIWGNPVGSCTEPQGPGHPEWFWPPLAGDQAAHIHRLHNFSSTNFLSFFFCLSRAAPLAYGDSQARSRIRAAAAGLRHSHSNAGSESRLRPTPQFTATPDP